jgi:hypothetical protein
MAANNPCSLNPCQNNGICSTNLVTGSYNCLCLPGYTGQNCVIRKSYHV